MTRDERERLHDDLTLIQDWLEAGRVRARAEVVFEEGAPPPSEAEIIAKAGKKGSITVATNMAGRGVDIIFPAWDRPK